ncbi:TIGR00725 family protein [Caldinitratiruptor microaerophilus]|uniref:TIGR00725 family protein n=1 Tax=Caldinitratiruptor microaerophilus TaxID=671077 RepID=A0AA35CJG4_9FIRM|nr:TIGR00725 family protein [Caldinitratiruptor microaerophilus]BDG59589.1 hypothetical protein caldi_06790 [Caldinitratiruptor microaerophilus]
MPLRIAVIGQSGEIGPKLRELARRVGAAVAAAGAILFTGGRDGVMAAASQGAREAGGVTVGILPGDDLGQANPYVDIPITTGLTMEGRSQVLIHTADAVVAVGGGNGTLGEISNAYLYRKPIVAVRGSGGWADRLQPVLIEGKYLDHRRLVAIRFASDPEEAVRLALELAGAAPAAGPAGGPPWDTVQGDVPAAGTR